MKLPTFQARRIIANAVIKTYMFRTAASAEACVALLNCKDTTYN